MMQVVILAGGLGTRLRNVAPNVPKSLVPVAGRPFVDHQLALLRQQGFTRVLMCVGHGADLIERHVGNGQASGVTVTFSREDPARLLGTGGALINALPLLEDEFLVLYGDSYLPTDYAAIVRAFRESGCPALMSVYRNQGRWDRSNVRVADGRVVFYSKSAEAAEVDCIDYGLSAYRRHVLEALRGTPLPLDLAALQRDLVARGEMAAHVVPDRFYEIGKPEGLAEVDRLLSVAGVAP